MAHFWPEWKMSAYDENVINHYLNALHYSLVYIHATFFWHEMSNVFILEPKFFIYFLFEKSAKSLNVKWK